LGIDISVENILTSSSLTAKYLSHISPNSSVYVIGEEGLKKELQAEGLTVVNDWEEENEEDIFDFDFEKVGYVVTGMDRALNYTKISRAVHLLQNQEGVNFIATNKDFTFPTVKGLIPGGGAMIAILEELSDREVERVIGKPEPEMYRSALEIAQTDTEQAIMFGDRLETDILGANRIGLNTCLVLTGVTNMNHLASLTEETAPTIIINDLQDAITSFKSD
jgi:4-nitrophenyl phosphatase